jgi:pyruvate-formate lyase-activating enzyme
MIRLQMEAEGETPPIFERNLDMVLETNGFMRRSPFKELQRIHIDLCNALRAKGLDPRVVIDEYRESLAKDAANKAREQAKAAGGVFDNIGHCAG